jgi:hypothetical protein
MVSTRAPERYNSTKESRMRLRLVCSMLLVIGISLSQPAPTALTIRHIRIKLVSTTPGSSNPIDIATIMKALRSSGVNIALENRLDPAQLPAATAVIRDLYRESGRSVRVDYSVTQIPPRALELVFEVVELCDCK